jgi:hypothetical protein
MLVILSTINTAQHRFSTTFINVFHTPPQLHLSQISTTRLEKLAANQSLARQLVSAW